MIVGILIMICMSVPAYYYSMRYNLHMLQLNGYHDNEHILWMKKHVRLQWVLLWGMVAGIAGILFPVTAVVTLLIFSAWIIWMVYRAMKHLYSKKKLVYTARIKRLIATNIILSLLILAALLIFLGIKSIPGGLLLLIGMQFFMSVVADVINRPVEKLVKSYYINDAKKKLRENPKLVVIGVTGSYGKTSVKFYLQTLLQAGFDVLVTPESYNTPMGVVKTIRESLKKTHEIFVCEMGARHVGDIKEICDIVSPDHGVITTVGPQHLETFFSIENVKKTKFELADALPADGKLFLNGDNEYIKEASHKYGKQAVFYSKDEKNGYHAENISVSQMGTEFDVVSPDGSCEHFQTKLVGEHNVLNIVGAITVANQMGIALKDLRIPVRKLQPVEHRMQLREHGLVTIIDDAYNSNPVGSKAAVETLAMFNGVRILVTPGMVELGEKEEEYNYKFGEYAAECCDYILLVGKKHTRPIMEGAVASGFSQDRCLSFDKLEEAMSYAYGIKEQQHKYILLENDLPDNY